MNQNPFIQLALAASVLWLFCASPVIAAGPSNDAFMNQSFQQFDQNLETGWRTLQLKRDYLGAADAILQYQSVHAAQLNAGQKGSLSFHLAHVYAMAREKGKAIEWFQKSLTTGGMGNPAYIQGFIAFLQGDKTALADARHTLATTNSGPWQAQDLDEMDGMLSYFDQPFEAAWGALNCHDPGMKVDSPEWIAYCRAVDAKYRDVYLAHGVKLPPG
jgi:hypothetical protein